MKTTFAFGKTGIEVSVPDVFSCVTVETRSAVALDDEMAALHHALDQPLGCPSLGDLAKGRKTVAIAICDITRPAPNWITLPPLLEHLHRAGISRETQSPF